MREAMMITPGGAPVCEHCGVHAYAAHEDNCPDRFKGTSFADAIECAIHYALVELSVEEQGRGPRSEGGQIIYPDLSDLYIKYRRLIRDLAEGKIDPNEYLRSRE